MESFKKSDFIKHGLNCDFVQENHSKSLKNVIRGLHFQKNPKAQDKLIRCIKGKILDVAVDIRKGSPTYGKFVSVILSSENNFQFYIPKGFAHGFLCLESDSEIEYKCTNEYSPEHESGILWNDQTLGINWQIDNPIISKKDLSLSTLSNSDNNFIYDE